MSDLVAAVRSEHRQILELADRLLEECGRSPGGAHASRKTVHALVVLESRHEAAEARVLWPAVRDALRGDFALRETAQRQEREARRALHRLHKVAGTGSGTEMAPGVVRALRLHVALEESHVLPALESALSRNETLYLGSVYEAISARAPTRPHPLTPAVPGVLAMSAPLARRIDRLRDLLRIR